MDVFDKLKFWKDKHSHPDLNFDLDSGDKNNAPNNDLNVNQNLGSDNNNINQNYPGNQQNMANNQNPDPNFSDNMGDMNSQTDFMSGVNSPMDYSQDDFYSKDSNEMNNNQNNPQSSLPFNNNMNPSANNNMDLNQDSMGMNPNFNPNQARPMDEMSNMGVTSRPAGEFVSDNKRGYNNLPNNSPPENNNPSENTNNSTHKFELINSKLDTIKAMLDHLNQRMVNIENKINNDNQRW